jgi:hypothetical protein
MSRSSRMVLHFYLDIKRFQRIWRALLWRWTGRKLNSFFATLPFSHAFLLRQAEAPSRVIEIGCSIYFTRRCDPATRDDYLWQSPSQRKLQMKNKKCCIVLRLDESVVDAIDSVRDSLRMDRSTWLRKAVARNLEQNKREVRLVDRPEIRAVLMP